MNRRDFIKTSAAASVVPVAILHNNKPIDEQKPIDKKKLPSTYYQVNCYVFDYATNARKNYDDLWTYPEPTFTNIDSALEFINDHKKTFDLKLVNVMYDVTFITPRLHSTVASSSHNSAGTYGWVDRPPHQRWDHDCV